MEQRDVTQLLQSWRAGSSEAEGELFSLVMPDLRRIAHYLIKRERPGHTLQATELVDQIYLRLVDARGQDWQNRKHFFAIAARAMRRYLIDYARGRPRVHFVILDDVKDWLPADPGKMELALSVGNLLDELAAINADWCTLVELKYFLGLTDEEAAGVLGIKLRTMQRMWLEARNWLFQRLQPRAMAGALRAENTLADSGGNCR